MLVCSSCRYLEQIGRPIGTLAPVSDFGTWLAWVLDDLIKAEKKRNLGLTAKQKIAGQLILAAFFCWGCVETLHLPYSISIPFSSMEIEIGALYYIFAVLVVVGASNAVNLTDGLDGLASGCSVVTFLAYSVYCYVNGIHDIGLFSAILAGGCVGFLFSIIIRLKFSWETPALWL